MQFKFNSGFFEQSQELIIGISSKTDKPANLGIDQHFGAQDARRMSAVNSAVFNADAVKSSLNNNILLGMDRPADFSSFSGGYAQCVSQTTQFQAIMQSGGCAVISRGQNMLISDSHCAHMMPLTGGPLGDYRGDL